MPVVKVIPQKINPMTKQAIATTKKRRVAAYARVSTDSDEQFTSFTAQVDYYTNLINGNPIDVPNISNSNNLFWL